MNWINWFLIGFTIVSCLSVAVLTNCFRVKKLYLYNWWKKNYYINTKYLINLLISIGYLAYFISLRYSKDVEQFIAHKDLIYSDPFNLYDELLYFRSFRISKVFLLDWCPCFSVIISLFAIFDYKQKYVNLMGLIGFCFGFITLIGGLIGQERIEVDQFWTYVTVGVGLNQIYFGLHFYLCIFGLYLFSNLRRFDVANISLFHAVLISFMIYVPISVHFWKVTNNASGYVMGDWIPLQGSLAQFEIVGKIINQHFIINAFVMFLWMYLAFVAGFFAKLYILKTINKKDQKSYSIPFVDHKIAKIIF
ncbi:DUF5378 family protein [Ureaplasma diversum]|uniref:Transmembrane protein n=1 Tax=Ureaplasma diversum NCTC 246 TaxID=1188241 RepID=A0A084EXL1_9BACT|nr:DUF5378 family protein [Ureaplasma diversum]KEZ22703.1 Hypothetical protein, predicted transmembrane protein [Ureaplasma diversum NCTC 246]